MECKVFLKDWVSKLESTILNLPLSLSINISKYIVNPTFYGIVGKILIITLPYELRLGKLSLLNKIISRFPIQGVEYDLIPYELPKERLSVPKKDYSLLILNKHMLMDIENAKSLDDKHFLLGTDSHIDGYITSVGYKLVSTDLNNLINH